MGKTLIVFYSRGGTTRTVAEAIASSIQGEIEAITDRKKRTGVIGTMSAGKDGSRGKSTRIDDTRFRPKDFELVIIGTPIWAGGLSPAIRTYLERYKDEIKEYALFCTCETGDPGKAFSQVEKIMDRKPLASIPIPSKEVKQGSYQVLTERFIRKLT